MLSHLKFGRVVLTVALAASACLFPLNVFADSLPSGERTLGNATIEPAYNDANGSIVYLLTPNRLAPLGASNPINTVDSNAVAPLYLVVYPPGTGGTFNCKGVPGNCPDHDTVVADVVTSPPPIGVPTVYGTDPSAIPGHDHLVGLAHTGDFNVPWHVYIEMFTSSAAVMHITTLTQLKAAWSSGAIQQFDTGITFVCAVVSENAYRAGAPVA